MVAALDNTDNVFSFATARIPAWHQLGQVVDQAMTAEEALREAHLAGWNVRKLPLQVPAGAEPGLDAPVEIERHHALVRTNPINGGTEYLGVAGDVYTPIQNESMAGLVDALVDEGGAHFETAGGLHGGRQVFMTLKLPTTLDLMLPGGSGVDRTEWYIAALNSHDNSSAFKFLVTPVRIVCANTQQIAIARAASSFSIRHTSSASQRVDEARRALGLTFKYEAEFQREMQELVDKQTTDDTARALLATVFDVEGSASERQQRSRERHVEGAMAALKLDTNDGIAGTAYGVFNAVSEYIDHGWPVRGADEGVVGVANAGNAFSTISGQFADLKTRTLKVLQDA